MRFVETLLLTALAGAVNAATQTPASAYIFSRSELADSSNAPIVSPQEARLILAQRLGVSQFHDVTEASDATLEYINAFGGSPQQLLNSKLEEEPSQLVIIVDGINNDFNERLNAASKVLAQPAFQISDPPTKSANAQLVKDFIKQNFKVADEGCELSSAIYPSDESCWDGNAMIIHLDASKKNVLTDLINVLPQIESLSSKGDLETVLVLMPASATKSSNKPYGSYETTKKTQIARRQQEEPLTETFPEVAADEVEVVSQGVSSAAAPLVPLPVCYSDIDACTVTTGNCSGHGTCFRKYDSCYACGCVPTVEKNGEYIKTTHWGGSTCAKKDVSGTFWLIAIFTVTLVGIISWSIGLLFSVGNEKLPGVIGAGVSGPKAR